MPEHAQAASDHERQSRRRAPEVAAPEAALAVPGAQALFAPGVFRVPGVEPGAPEPPPAALSATLRQARVRGLGQVYGNQQVGRMLARRAGGEGVLQRQGAPGAGPAPTGVMSTSEALKARAQEALKNVYGSVKQAITGRVEVVDDATIRSNFDDMQIRKGTKNPRTQETWQKGDSTMVFPQLFGFADRENGVVYVLEAPSGGSGEEQLSTTIHEMLHLNAAGDWASTMGGTFDEGQTEIMTMKVCKSQNIPITPAYEGQRGWTEKLAEAVGAHTLEQAYFGGASVVVTTFETLKGEGKWADLKKAIGEGNADKVNKILKAPRMSTWAKEKLAIIKDLLDWWVSDEDVAKIEIILRSATPEDRKAMAPELEDDIDDLMNFGHRARIRIALGA